MYYVGIDLGGTNIAAGILDESLKIVKKGSVPTGNTRHYSDIIKDMAMLVIQLLKETGISKNEVDSIGIGGPGTCDRENGVLLYTNNIKFEDVPMRSEMQKYIPLQVYLENDANCAALGESMAGAARDVSDSITITLGTGIGGGIILNNKIYIGFNGMAGEIGHIVLNKQGEICTCGRKGCWEAYASATALIKQTRNAAQKYPESLINSLVNGDLNRIDAKTAFDAMRQGDSIGTSVVNEYIAYLGEGVSDLINIFQPSRIVIGGGISKEGDTILVPLREIARKSTYFGEGDVPHTQIVEAQLGNDAGIVGAAMLGRAAGLI